MYFIGQTRFSLYVPNSVAWNVSNFTEQEYIEHLFSDERMSVRAKIFSEISIPLMAEMRKNFDFRHIVSYSSILPEKWKNILFDLAKKYDFIYLHEADSHKENPIYSVLNGKPDGSVAFFRLDDDDLLSIDYLDALSKYNNIAFKNMAISFGKGIAGFYKDDNYIDFRDVVQKYPSMGQAYIGYWKDRTLELPPLYSHHNLDQNIPVIVDSMNTIYLQTYHEKQDSNYRFSNNTNNLSIEEELAKYSKTKDYNNLINKFPTLEQDVYNFLENKDIYFTIGDITLDKKINIIPIDNNTKKKLYEIEYKLNLSEKLVSPKAMLLSFIFEDDVKVTSGLTLSSNPDISWYKYLGSANGIASGNFSFTVEKPTKLRQIKLIIWDNKFNKIDVDYINIL